jgi:nucleolar protein 58
VSCHISIMDIFSNDDHLIMLQFNIKLTYDLMKTLIENTIYSTILKRDCFIFQNRYGWHFPELGKILTDNIAFIKTIKLVGMRENFHDHDLSDILPTDLEEKVKEAAEVSMGTEISDEDIINISQLCDEILAIHEYRTHLYDYLKTRMMAIAPNLTTLVGETVGARLIAHAGSLTNLAKHPASTVQILGAEKALFRALKTKKDTPKYGLIYHSTLVGQASTKNKGKISRSLAAKASLATRVDAFGEESTFDLGTDHRARLETRLRILEEGNMKRISGAGKVKAKFEKHHAKSEIKLYPTEEDNQIPIVMSKKRKLESDKPLIEEIKAEDDEEEANTSSQSPKKKKKKKDKTLNESEVAETSTMLDETVEEDGKS